ncbi:MAG: hypothetical protein QCH96_05655 [Candidatus Thermoplasmatota archaeon]|nr:hypothetical protein [Candidatus Thermoplasmatota archaeon]
MNKRKKNTRHMKDDSSAVVGIVTSILLVGLFISIFAIIQTVYVPQWMEEIESEHMNVVSGQFSQMKFAIDLQLLGTNQTVNPSISSPIQLGSEKIPYLLSSRASGTLSVYEECTTIFVENISHSHIFVLNGIRYQSQNSYYVDQTYLYESGAVIISQREGSFLSSPPFFYLQNQTNKDMIMTLVNVTSVGRKSSTNGYDTTLIRTQYDPALDQTLVLTNITTLRIATQHPNSWSNYMNETLTDAAMIYGQDYTIDVSTIQNTVTISYASENTCSLYKKTLKAQISPGWIT